ncbi:MAG: cytidine deaminase [Ruminococcus sp.]|nr:cytidine deaminase [Ruminococcus sp.]
MTNRELIKSALAARENSHSPYSEFRVGAALLCADGKVYTGCNIENASYSATVCAERTAIFKAVSEGCRDFSAIAIVGGNSDKMTMAYPCGVCRQVMSEFCKKDFRIIVAESEEKYEEYTLGELLPKSFEL